MVPVDLELFAEYSTTVFLMCIQAEKSGNVNITCLPCNGLSHFFYNCTYLLLL
jgi:hypothetical protein